MAEETVAGGGDVLDLGTGLGFQQGDRVDQHGGIRDQVGRLLELGQCGAGRDALPENRLGFHVTGGRQVRQFGIGPVGAPGWQLRHVLKKRI